jgi:hypothetical protein
MEPSCKALVEPRFSFDFLKEEWMDGWMHGCVLVENPLDLDGLISIYN